MASGCRRPPPTAARTSQRPRDESLSHPSPLGLRRVRSIIMLQEKAQDRERLLLKFIKIMKVTWGPLPSGNPPPVPAHPHGCLPPSPQHLRKLNNFNSYLAILSALDSAPIRRLEWQKQTSEVGRRRLVSGPGAREAGAGRPLLGPASPGAAAGRPHEARVSRDQARLAVRWSASRRRRGCRANM